MNLTIFLVLIAVSALAFVAEWLVIKAAYKLKLFDTPNVRKIHHQRIPRLGGLIIVPILLLGMFLFYSLDEAATLALFKGNETALVGMLMATGVVYIFGFFDDLVNIRYRNKFVAQIFSGVAMCLSGLMISSFSGFLGVNSLPIALAWLATIFATIYISNAINFIDGIDGLAGSLAIIALAYYAVIFHMTGFKGVVMVCILIACAVVPLLIFNLFGAVKNHTKVFMGDAGSLSLGILLCGMGVFVVQRVSFGDATSGSFALAVAPLMLPCFDVVRVVIVRRINGRNVFEADKSHIHHKFLAMGMTQHQTLLCLIGVDLVMVLSTVWLSTMLNVNLVILVEVLLFVGLIQLINRKLKQKQI